MVAITSKKRDRIYMRSLFTLAAGAACSAIAENIAALLFLFGRSPRCLCCRRSEGVRRARLSDTAGRGSARTCRTSGGGSLPCYFLRRHRSDAVACLFLCEGGPARFWK